jgi:hypothetical protein
MEKIRFSVLMCDNPSGTAWYCSSAETIEGAIAHWTIVDYNNVGVVQETWRDSQVTSIKLVRILKGSGDPLRKFVHDKQATYQQQNA